MNGQALGQGAKADLRRILGPNVIALDAMCGGPDPVEQLGRCYAYFLRERATWKRAASRRARPRATACQPLPAALTWPLTPEELAACLDCRALLFRGQQRTAGCASCADIQDRIHENPGRGRPAGSVDIAARRLAALAALVLDRSGVTVTSYRKGPLAETLRILLETAGERRSELKHLASSGCELLAAWRRQRGVPLDSFAGPHNSIETRFAYVLQDEPEPDTRPLLLAATLA